MNKRYSILLFTVMFSLLIQSVSFAEFTIIGGSEEENKRLNDYFNNRGSSSLAPGQRTMADITPPTAPGKPTATRVTKTSISVRWGHAVDNHAVVGYAVYLNNRIYKHARGDINFITFTNLKSNTRYQVAIRAYDTRQNMSKPSSILHVRTR